MAVKRQQGNDDQLDLFDQGRRASLRLGATGEGGTGSGACAEPQALTAWEQQRALTQHLMEEVASSANLNQAYKRVKANQGAAGVDGMSLADLLPWIRENREKLIASLLDGSYHPKTVRGAEIPKPGGGNRQLGIPTVVDRLVQQAILQVLEPILDPTFSPSSFGFRPGKSAHQALAQARTYVADGREIVVDMDLEKFFDRVNHDILMARVARRTGDKRLLRIIRRFLEAGMMQNGVCIERYEGTPQGGPVSPLLANLLLDDLDKELERRGHCFCRYADDCNIYVQSQAAGERVMASVVDFLEGGLRLKVNRKKSAVAPTKERSFLGHRLLPGGRLGLAPKSLDRVKDKLRQMTRRNRGISLERMIAEVNSFVTRPVLHRWRMLQYSVRQLCTMSKSATPTSKPAASRQATHIHVGIGGWTFAPWRGVFYPDGLPHAKELSYAASHLTSIEINGTFYRTQTPATFRKWASEVPGGFIFSVKGPRFVTHRSDLREAGGSIDRFLNSGVTELGDRLGPLLWQFPPTKKFDEADFAGFLELLPRNFHGTRLRHVVEVRHRSFCVPDFIRLLREFETPVVFSEHETYPAIADVTGDFLYLRLQKGEDSIPTAYPDAAIAAWADRMRGWLAGQPPDDLPHVEAAQAKARPRDIFAYFIHEGKVRAPAGAMALIEKLKS